MKQMKRTLSGAAAASRPWFIRTRGRHGCGIKPAAFQGHLLTAAFTAWVTGIAWFIAAREPDMAEIVSAVAIVLASTLLYLVTVLRMSGPAPRQEKRR